MTQKIEVGEVVSHAFSKGIANILPLFVNTLLWALTIWIPYLNVGTTIGLMTGVLGKLASGESLSMTEVFNSDYRKYMGQYFLVSIFVGMGTFIGFTFLIIPGIVISISWMFAPILVVNKGLQPLDAIQKSNEATYGNRLQIFLVQIVISVLISIIFGVVSAIAFSVPDLMLIWAIVFIAVMAFALSISLTATAYIYNKLFN